MSSLKKMEKVSLILTTYNSEENLPRTLASIEMQDYPDVEVVIKDGGSTDKTLEIICAYEQSSKYQVHWTRCPDTGIYDAMNQGYALATGTILVFFNDLFMGADVITRMITLIQEHPDCAGAHADLIYATDDKVMRYWHMGPQKSLVHGWMPGHPTLFLKRQIYEKYGLYKTDYRIAADYEFMIRFLKEKENRLVYLPDVIIRMYYGGTSTSNTGSYLCSLKEGHRALRENKIRFAAWIDGLRTLRVLLQFVIKGKGKIYESIG